MQEAYRTGGAKAQLVPLLERCTRELEAFPRYRGDHRYLRVWIQYARCSSLCVFSIYPCPVAEMVTCTMFKECI